MSLALGAILSVKSLTTASPVRVVRKGMDRIVEIPYNAAWFFLQFVLQYSLPLFV